MRTSITLSAGMSANFLTVAIRSASVLEVVGAMSFGRPSPMRTPLMSITSTLPFVQPPMRFMVSTGRVFLEKASEVLA